jgi:mRNA interferase MazF
MPEPTPGEIWQVDLGMAAKVRPCIILSDYPSEDELALILVAPHTTSLRGNKWEFKTDLPFLKPGAIHLQQIQPVSLVRLERFLGRMPTEALQQLRRQTAELLHLQT